MPTYSALAMVKENFNVKLGVNSDIFFCLEQEGSDAGRLRRQVSRPGSRLKKKNEEGGVEDKTTQTTRDDDDKK